MTILKVQSSVTKTAAFDGLPVAVATITGDWTLKLHAQSLSDSSTTTPLARFSFEDSVNDFTASLAGPTVSFQGTLGTSYDKVKSFKKQDFPDLRLGVGSAELRLRLLDLETAGTVTYDAWLEY